MTLTKQIRHQIKEWIQSDAKCVALKAKIDSLKKQQRDRWTTFRARQQSEHWQMFRELKRIDDFRVSIAERRKQVHRIALAHTKTLSRQSIELRRDLSQLETKLALVTHAMGARRGFLRKDLTERFVKMAVKETLRRRKAN